MRAIAMTASEKKTNRSRPASVSSPADSLAVGSSRCTARVWQPSARRARAARDPTSGLSERAGCRILGWTDAVPSRNRVTPMGDIEAFALRGAWTGNRGIIHEGREIVRFHASDLWITCALEFRGWWREQWLPHRWTHLFFYDEAVSFAAGHRPCAECRRADYNAYKQAGPALGRRSAARRGR